MSQVQFQSGLPSSDTVEQPESLRTNAISRAFEDVVARRRSVRAFKPEPIPPALLEHVFTVAGKAPSNCNAQPWVTHVVSGQALRRIRDAFIVAEASGEHDSDVPITSHYVDRYKERRIGAAVALFQATGVGRHDTAARRESFLRNYHFFDAPHAAFFFMPRYFGLREAVDIGMYAQTLMLALTAHGLASCAQGSTSYYASMLRRELGIQEDIICLFGLSFGWADEGHPSSKAITDRAALTETVVFHG